MNLADFGIDDNWYDREGNVIDEATVRRHLASDAYRFVGLTEVKSADNAKMEYRVSTVWTGRNYGSPTYFTGLFDTLVSDAKGAQVLNERHATLAEAEGAHKRIVAHYAALHGSAVVTDMKG